MSKDPAFRKYEEFEYNITLQFYYQLVINSNPHQDVGHVGVLSFARSASPKGKL